MKVMAWCMSIVFLVTLGVCLISMQLQFRVLDMMEKQCGEATACVLAEDIPGAMKHVHTLHATVENSSRFMETVASHDQLHEAIASITEAQVALECEDLDDAYQALAALEGTIEHLRDHETLSIANIC